jgi:hypothetical protein
MTTKDAAAALQQVSHGMLSIEDSESYVVLKELVLVCILARALTEGTHVV